MTQQRLSSGGAATAATTTTANKASACMRARSRPSRHRHTRARERAPATRFPRSHTYTLERLQHHVGLQRLTERRCACIANLVIAETAQQANQHASSGQDTRHSLRCCCCCCCRSSLPSRLHAPRPRVLRPIAFAHATTEEPCRQPPARPPSTRLSRHGHALARAQPPQTSTSAQTCTSDARVSRPHTHAPERPQRRFEFQRLSQRRCARFSNLVL